MSKQKTIKAVAKRFRITKNKKVIKQKSGKGHFNSRESGKVTRNKRRSTSVDNKKLAKNIQRFIPHN